MGFRGRVGFAGRGGFRGGRGGFFQPGLGGQGGRPVPTGPATGAANGTKDDDKPAPTTADAPAEDATAGGAEGGKWSDEPTPAELKAAAAAGAAEPAAVKDEQSTPAAAAAPAPAAQKKDKEPPKGPAAAAQNGAPALTAAQKGKGVSGRTVPKGATMSWAQIAKCVAACLPPVRHRPLKGCFPC